MHARTHARTQHVRRAPQSRWYYHKSSSQLSFTTHHHRFNCRVVVVGIECTPIGWVVVVIVVEMEVEMLPCCCCFVDDKMLIAWWWWGCLIDYPYLPTWKRWYYIYQQTEMLFPPTTDDIHCTTTTGPDTLLKWFLKSERVSMKKWLCPQL